MGMNNFEDLLKEQIQDLYSAEQQLVKALPKMEKAASSSELKKAFNDHLKETKHQAERLEKIADILECKPKGKKCHGMEGLLKEGEETISEKNMDNEVRDAGLIADAQRVEHYEIAGYGTARSMAQRLGHEKVVKLLQETLEEEGAADKKLTKICESLHPAGVV